MAPVIYTSPHPRQELPSTSLFTFLFSGNHDPASPAYIDVLTKRVLSRADVRSMALQVGYSARNQLKLKKGEVALVFSPNSIAWPVVLLGIVAAGGIATLANASYTPPELAHQYKDSGARLLFVHPALLPVAQKMFESIGVSKKDAEARMVLMDLDSTGANGIRGLKSLITGKALSQEEPFDGKRSHETAVVCYSSGTTGRPKGVETTHRNLSSDISLLNAVSDWGKHDTFIGVLPFFHVYGLVMLVLNPLLLGAAVAVVPQFVPDVFFRALEEYRITRAMIVPPIALAFVHHPAAAKHDLRTLKTIVSGAAPLSGELISILDKRLKSLGTDVTITQGFGMTELSPVSHFVCFPDARRGKATTIGQLLPNLEARLIASDERNIVDAKVGEPGELWVRGPIVMKRYLKNEKATKDTMTKDGWLKTGDVAIIDKEGFFSIVDRKKELIKYKGFQVSPAELEDLLLGHPEIMDAAVIGIPAPDNSGNELPRAYVVRAPKSTSEPDVFVKYIASRVAKHKQLLGGVVFIDAIPKSAAGKILRRELRERAKAERPVKAKLLLIVRRGVSYTLI
ncbi:unnamed protein product [Peniophora sp. CBMAI 1063]|nr:unnamed protein product [Peniophora sp. CBMAI 1063]